MAALSAKALTVVTTSQITMASTICVPVLPLELPMVRTGPPTVTAKVTGLAASPSSIVTAGWSWADPVKETRMPLAAGRTLSLRMVLCCTCTPVSS